MSHERGFFGKILDAVRESDQVELFDVFISEGSPSRGDDGYFYGATITLQIPHIDLDGAPILIDIEATNYYDEVYYDIHPSFFFERQDRPFPHFPKCGMRVLANGSVPWLIFHEQDDEFRVWESFTHEQIIQDVIKYAEYASKAYSDWEREQNVCK